MQHITTKESWSSYKNVKLDLRMKNVAKNKESHFKK